MNIWSFEGLLLNHLEDIPKQCAYQGARPRVQPVWDCTTSCITLTNWGRMPRSHLWTSAPYPRHPPPEAHLAHVVIQLPVGQAAAGEADGRHIPHTDHQHRPPPGVPLHKRLHLRRTTIVGLITTRPAQHRRDAGGLSKQYSTHCGSLQIPNIHLFMQSEVFLTHRLSGNRPRHSLCVRTSCSNSGSSSCHRRSPSTLPSSSLCHAHQLLSGSVQPRRLQQTVRSADHQLPADSSHPVQTAAFRPTSRFSSLRRSL